MLKAKKNGCKVLCELKEGIASAVPFFLSHHEKKNYHKCLFFLGVPLCARCSGVYLGFFCGVLAFFFGLIKTELFLLLILALPAPALVDWFFYHYKKRDFGNFVRFTTGFLLGFSFILGVISLLIGLNQAIVIGVGLGYGLLATGLIILESKQREKRSKK